MADENMAGGLEEMLDAQLAEALAQEEEGALTADGSIDLELERALASLDLENLNLGGIDGPDSEDGGGSGAPAGEEGGGGAGGEPMTIDEETLLDLKLAEALEKDEAAEEAAPEALSGVEDFVQDVAVFSEEAEYVPPEKVTLFGRINAWIEGLPPKLLMGMVAAMAVFAVGGIAAGATMFVRAVREEARLEAQGTIIRVGGAASNSAGFIYPNAEVAVPGGAAKLVKMNLSRVSSVLYFDRDLPPGEYDMKLTDDWGREYYPDYSYREQGTVWFDPLPPEFKYFLLTITERGTQTSASSRFTAGQVMTMGFARYLGQPLAVDCDSESVSVEVSGAVFSNTGSQISVAVKRTSPGEDVLLSKDPGGEFVKLSENGRLTLRAAHGFESYDFPGDGVTLYRVDFDPMRNLADTVRIEFDDMYKSLSVNADVLLSDILYTKPNPEKPIDAGPYRLVVERGGVQINQFVLVMHAEDTRLPELSAMSNRVQAFPNVTMTARNAGGETRRYEPKLVRDAWNGTDVVFDCSADSDFFTGISPEQITFEINSVHFKLPAASVEFDLDSAERALPINPSSALGNISDAFMRRMRHQTGEYGAHELDRFSSGVLENSALMNLYPQSGAPADRASGSVHVPLWYLDGDKFYAIVRETWRAYPGEFFHREHKAVSEYGTRGWIVTEDEILSEGFDGE